MLCGGCSSLTLHHLNSWNKPCSEPRRASLADYHCASLWLVFSSLIITQKFQSSWNWNFFVSHLTRSQLVWPKKKNNNNKIEQKSRRLPRTQGRSSGFESDWDFSQSPLRPRLTFPWSIARYSLMARAVAFSIFHTWDAYERGSLEGDIFRAAADN